MPGNMRMLSRSYATTAAAAAAVK